MDRDMQYQIEAEAARALAEWKAIFAEHVSAKAKELADESGTAGVVTLGHYRQAASIAAGMLVTTIQDTDSIDGNQEAA